MASWRNSAALRIALAYSTSFAFAVVVLGAVIFLAMHIAFMRHIDATLVDEAQTLAIKYHSDGPSEFAEAIALRESIRGPRRMLYAVFGPGGRHTAGRLVTTRPPPGVHDIEFTDPVEGPDSARGVVLDLDRDHRLVVAADREWIEQIDRTIVEVFGIGMVAVCLLGLGGALLFGSYLRRRLSAFSRGAEAFIEGDFAGRMPTSGRHDEFDELAITLNAMLERIESLLENLRQVSSDVAHDLRTPLTRLRQRLELALAAGSGTPTEPLVADALDRLDEALALFEAILIIAAVQSGSSLDFRRLDLSALALDITETYAPVVHEGGRSFQWEVEPGISIIGEPNLIAQAIANLIDNAQRHTPTGTSIRLSLATSACFARITVADDGLGVAEADWALIVRRFGRLERSRSTSGFGLGLSFVATVAHRLRGLLTFADAGPGLIARLDLPLRAQFNGHVGTAEVHEQEC